MPILHMIPTMRLSPLLSTAPILPTDHFCGVPVVALEDLNGLYPPETHAAFVAIGYTRLNKIRIKLYETVKAIGYRCANYISSKAFVWPNVTMGDNVFIFENNTIQPFVTLGSNNIIWSGNIIGHHSTIGDHNFIASQVVISGNCRIGNGCFMAVNSARANDLAIADDNFIAMGAMVTKNTEKVVFTSVIRQRNTSAAARNLQCARRNACAD
jgi:sugar O-acyltransferase (sialic acid O-acetyltransferase NeuD family)